MDHRRPEAEKKAIPLGPHGRARIVTEKAKDKRSSMLRLWEYLRSQGKRLLLVVFLVAAGTGFELLGPYLMGTAIDRYIATGNLEGLGIIICIMVLVYVLGSGATLLQSLIMAEVSQYTVRHLRKDLFDTLQSLSLRFFDRHSHGDLMSRFSNDLDSISNVLNEGVTQLISGVLLVSGIVAVIFILNVKMALVTISVIPLIFLLSRWVAARTRKGYRKQQESLGVLNGMVEETITGARVVKAYSREKNVIDAFEQHNLNYKTHAVKAQTYMTVLGPTMGVLNNLNYTAIGCAGGYFAITGEITVGMMAIFLSYSRHFIRPINQVAAMYNSIQSALAGAERVFEILDQEPEIVDSPDSRPLTDVRGEVVFDSVTFSYKKGTPVLKNFSLHAAPGETIALVGPTGAGKTTIINLLTRFYDIDSGSITVDGHPIHQLKKDSLRQHIGIVLQDTYLFSDTVMENIRYGKLEADDAEVVAAAELSGASSFINRLPKLYHTQLIDKGSNLSHGQRQLLSIARTILAAPSILILDEATSSVDTRTETIIQAALLKLMKGRTSFVIAHRLSTIRDADRIIVIDKGKIVEQGTHKELLGRKGLYSKLCAGQFKGKTAAEITAEKRAPLM